MFQEADSYGSKTGNGNWSGIIELVSSGVADIGVGPFSMTKERSEVVKYTHTLGFLR